MTSGHDFIKTGDPDAHRHIQDRNGEVVLDQCRRCGQAEGELSPICPSSPVISDHEKLLAAAERAVAADNARREPGQPPGGPSAADWEFDRAMDALEMLCASLRVRSS